MSYIKGFAIPEGLSELGYKTAVAIQSFAKEHELDTGGCISFYSPQQWKERGEEYGKNSELIIVYDGGDLAQFFEYDYEEYSRIDQMSDLLKSVGAYTEACTCWYSAVYPRPLPTDYFLTDGWVRC